MNYNMILVEISDLVKTHAIKTTSYHVANAIYFPTTGMYTLFRKDGTLALFGFMTEYQKIFMGIRL